MFDVAIVGSGPAGASCAAFCAAAGLRTVLLEREKFPREKVCGDCLNPSCTHVLQRLGLAERVRALPHAALTRVDFIAIGGRTIGVDLPEDAEIAVKRSVFDELLMNRAAELGAEIRDGTIVSGITHTSGGWRINASGHSLAAHMLVAADGRNSTIARLLGLMPTTARERVGLQTHLPLPPDFGQRVVLQFLPQGYSGQAPVGGDELNLCVVGKPSAIPALRAWAEKQFGLSPSHTWRTITPLRRAPISPAHRGLFFVGDAARVVEPFTGEGIFYALASGELAAETIAGNRDDYATRHEQLYRGRLWVNRIARSAVLSPRMTSALLGWRIIHPKVLRALTRKIVV
jgi:geranylgeranyl reductase family protein